MLYPLLLSDLHGIHSHNILYLILSLLSTFIDDHLLRTDRPVYLFVAPMCII